MSFARSGGLTEIYGGKDRGFFRELPPVDGYPVAAYDSTGELNKTGRCQAAVGTSDHETVDISVQLSSENVGKTDPCTAVSGVAVMVIGNIRGGQ